MNWLDEIQEPFFRSVEDAESYMTRELPRTVPEGWVIDRPPGERLTWFLVREPPVPGEWENQDYRLHISNGLDFLILTYGNNDVGPFDLHHALQCALVIETGMLRRFSLGECLAHLFSDCKPNEWGYT